MRFWPILTIVNPATAIFVPEHQTLELFWHEEESNHDQIAYVSSFVAWKLAQIPLFLAAQARCAGLGGRVRDAGWPLEGS